jgi:HD-like signal output (HDOD) protein
MLADQIAERRPVEFAEGAFVSGLLHDFGRMLIALALPADFLEIRQLRLTSGASWHDCERKLLDHDHAYYSALAVEKWNLPEPVQRAVAAHHEPQPFTGVVTPLSLVLASADALANELGYGVFEEPDQDFVGDPGQPLQLVGLSEEAGEIVDRFSAEMNSFRSVLN